MKLFWITVLSVCASVVVGHAQSGLVKSLTDSYSPSTPSYKMISMGEFAKLGPARAKRLGQTFETVANDRMDADTKRADLIRQIVLKNDTVEIAARVSIVTKDAPETMLERVLSRYVTDELVQREEEAKKKK